MTQNLSIMQLLLQSRRQIVRSFQLFGNKSEMNPRCPLPGFGPQLQTTTATNTAPHSPSTSVCINTTVFNRGIYSPGNTCMTYQKVHNRNGGTRRKLFSHGVSGRPCLDSLVHLKKKGAAKVDQLP